MIRHFLIAGIIVGLLCAVGGCNRKKIPLDKKQFTALLIDMHRIDGTLASERGRTVNNELKNYAYYNDIFQKYGITRTEFDSCMYYYSAQNAQFVKMYDIVIDSLNRQRTSIDKVLNELRVNDSVNYFPQADTLLLDSVYTVTLDSIVPGLYKFNTTLKFDSVDQSRSRRIHSYFLSEDKKDTLKVRDLIVQLDTLPRNYNWSQYTDSTYTHLVIHYLDVVPKKKIVRNFMKTKQTKPIVREEKKVDLKEFGGQAWNNQLFRPYISQRTEQRLKQGLPHK